MSSFGGYRRRVGRPARGAGVPGAIEPRSGVLGRYGTDVTPERNANDLAGRLAIVDEVLAEPPVIHYMSPDDAKAGQLTGVWSTEQSCYRFLAQHCGPGVRTLETGAGISTILFAAWGTSHRCITPGKEEADAVTAYCESHGISVDTLTFDISSSDVALTRLTPGAFDLDVVLIDGCHGFPAPMIDWYYGAGRLRNGGVVIVDDLQLPAVAVLQDFLDKDPRWASLAATGKWAAYQRKAESSLLEDWFTQPFYNGSSGALGVLRDLKGAARAVARPINRALRQRMRST